MERTKIGKRFTAKVALLTASTQGIGFGIAERLGRGLLAQADEAVEKNKAQGIEVLGLVCHVSNEQQRKNLIDMTVQKYGKIDVVVSNAAVNPTVEPILQTQESVLDKLWEINVKASILLLQVTCYIEDILASPVFILRNRQRFDAPHLNKGSSVILMSSIAGFHPQASQAMYGVTKTALLGLTKALAEEMAPDTRVNCVAPGIVPTKFASYITKTAAMREKVEENTLLNRLGTTEDMAAAAAFLASGDASYITGETLVVAGGMPTRL